MNSEKHSTLETLADFEEERRRSMHDIACGTIEAKVIPVIRTRATKGNETKENPLRWVTQYWSLGGELLAEKEEKHKQGKHINRGRR